MAFKKIYKEKLKLSVDGSTLKLSNLALSIGGKRTNLTADVSSAGTTLNVANYIDIADNDYLLIGEWGEPTAEIVQVNDASIDASITIGALVHDHYTDTPVTVIPCDKVKFYREITLIADPEGTNPTNQVGSDVAIMAYRKDTIILDGTNTTGYAYARFQSTEDTKYSEFTLGVAYEGNAYNSVEEMAKEACSMVGVEVGDEHASEDKILRDVNQAQNLIVKMQDWVFELIEDNTSIPSTENNYKYALSALTETMKYPNSKQGIMNVKFASEVLKYKDWHEFETFFADTSTTTAASTGSVGDTSLTLTDSYEFAASGTFYAGPNTITYTANNKTTGVLSGIPASGTGSIETEVASGGDVWQGLTPGTPEEYSIFNGNIYLDVPVETDEVGKKIKIKYLKQLTRFTDFSNTTEIPFYDALQFYIAYKVEIRRGNFDDAKVLKGVFDEIVDINIDAYKMPMMEQLIYHSFGFDSTDSDNDD